MSQRATQVHPVPSRTKPRQADCRGFTLIEMVVVTLLISAVMAVALPQLMPLIVLGRGEGAARHLAGFGRTAMAQATLMREDITVKFDLDKQTYWAERLVKPEEEEFFQDKDENGKDSKDKKDGKSNFMDLMGSSNMRKQQFGSTMGAEGDVLDEQAKAAQMQRDKFERYIRMEVESRANKLDKGSLFEEMTPLFEKKFSLEDTESYIEEIKDPLLRRTQMPDGVKIELLRVGSTDYSGGEVEIKLSSLGLFEPILFHVVNEDQDYFTVAWDPLTGTARFERGKKEDEEMKGTQ